MKVLLKIYFMIMASFSAHRDSRFQKKLSKTERTFRLCKIGLQNILFIFGRKYSSLFVLQICPIMTYLKNFTGCGVYPIYSYMYNYTQFFYKLRSISLVYRQLIFEEFQAFSQLILSQRVALIFAVARINRREVVWQEVNSSVW